MGPGFRRDDRLVPSQTELAGAFCLFRVDAPLAAGTAGRRDHWRALGTDRRWGLADAGIDPARRMDHAAGTVELLAQRLGRAAARGPIFRDLPLRRLVGGRVGVGR